MYTYDIKCPECGACTELIRCSPLMVRMDLGDCPRCHYEDGKSVKRIALKAIPMTLFLKLVDSNEQVC